MEKKDTLPNENTTSVESGLEHVNEQPPPERSLTRRLLSLAGASLAIFTSVGFMNAFGIFQAYYGLHQLRDYSDFDISWIGSFAAFLLFFGAAPAGILADRYGPRVPLLIGSFCILLGIFTTSACTEYWQFFLAQGLVLGFGTGFAGIPSIGAVAAVFKKNKGLVLGVSVGGSSIGGLIWPIMLNKLLNDDGVSFGWSIRAVGFLMLGCLVFAIITVPLGLPPRSKQVKKKAAAKISKRALLKKPPVILLCLAMIIIYLGLFTPFFYVSTYALSIGVDTNLSFYTVSILNGASLFGRLGAGLASDRLGTFNLAIFAVLSSALICLCWTAATTAAGVVVFAAAYGFTSGAIMSLQAACAAQLSTPESYGTVIGMIMGSAAITGLFGTPISGQLVNYGYLALSVYAGAALLVGGLLVLAARLSQNRKLLAKV